MSTIEERIANLSPAKRALLEQYLQTKATAHSPTPIIPRRTTDQSLPLSFAQQRLWFLQQLRPTMTAYHETVALWLHGPLQLTALHQSLNALIARHEVLRTTYVAHQGIPRQVINPPRPLALPLLDLCHLPPAEREAHIQEVAAAEKRQPFDLTTDLMRRAKVLRFSQEEHLFLLTSHHIASDGWSNSIFWRELAALYGAFTQGQPSPLPPLPIQYADYALWQRQTLQPETPNTRQEELLRYWQTHLAGAPPLLELPLDFPRPSEQQAVGKTWRFSIPLALTASLKTLARQEEATLFMLLLAAFHVLLMRYTQQTDLIVGTPIANRQLPEVEGLIGMFVNTLALRADLAGNPPFRTFLRQVRGTALAAYTHQDLPFEKLVEILHPQRNLQYQPLVQVALALHNTPSVAWQLPGLQVTRLPLTGETAKFDLYLSLTETLEGLDCRLEYDTALWKAATIERLAGHFTTLLAGLVATPDCPIEQLPLLTAAERQQLLVAWNQTATDYPRDRCIHHLVEAQVARTPDAIAVEFAEEQLSYRELNARANQLAHHLIGLGVQAEMTVGLCLERSVAMVVSLLAILKAGGAYVPLDPTYPQERLTLMLADTAAPVLVTNQRFAPLFQPTQIKLVMLDQPDSELTRQPRTNPQRALAATAPAYLIYTSGSTGIPKGVTIPHRAISRLLINTNYIDILPTDRIAQAANLAFDAATFEIWGALLHGATLVGMPREVSLVPYQLAAYLREQAISVLFLTTALFNQIARSLPDAFATLRVLLFGGESVDPTPVRLVLRQGAPAQLLHVYGPTESTTFSTWHLVHSVADDAHTIPIGVPLANTQLYILDSQSQPVPAGIAGELYIGGDGLALGYHNRPDLTAAKFLRIDFGGDTPPDHQSQPLYKTGDRVRYLANGAIEFLGRIDDQVKLHGFRIEPGEIEAVLNQHPAVANSIVIARTDQLGDKRLIAYVVPAQMTSHQENKAHAAALGQPLHTTLRDYLKKKLPDYMIPVAFVRLETLPLTPNGKVDRRALPAPELGQLRQAEPVAPPRSEVEKQVTALWQELLQLEQVSIHDNFFILGGHSLLTVQLVMQIKQRFAVALSLKHFFAGPTIAQLAAQIEQQKGAAVQTVPANQLQLPSLPPPLAALYDTIGVPGTLHKVTPQSGGRQWQLIHQALQRLPYRLRRPFARHFTSQLPTKRLFRKQRQTIARFLASIETDCPPEQALALSLCYGLLETYKVNMVQPGQGSPAAAVGTQLAQSRAQDKGVLLLLSHTTLQRWWKSPPIVQAHIGGAQHLTPRSDPDHAAITALLFARQVEYAHQILEQGGVAQIAADGQHGRSAMLLYNFHGRGAPFMTGFAELALATGAQVIPLTYTITATGEARFGLSAPLDPGATTLPHSARVAHLVAQYVAHLSNLWAAAPWLVPWYEMERHLAAPLRRKV